MHLSELERTMKVSVGMRCDCRPMWLNARVCQFASGSLRTRYRARSSGAAQLPAVIYVSSLSDGTATATASCMAGHDDQVWRVLKCVYERQRRVRRHSVCRSAVAKADSINSQCIHSGAALSAELCWTQIRLTLQAGDKQQRGWRVSRVQWARATAAAAAAAPASHLWHRQLHQHPTVPTIWLSCSRTANRCRPSPTSSYTSAEYWKMVSHPFACTHRPTSYTINCRVIKSKQFSLFTMIPQRNVMR